MLDATLRRRLERPLDRAAGLVDRRGISPDGLTLAGLAVGLGSAVAAGLTWWGVALVAWLVSRVLDGLDGPLARRRARRAGGVSPAGGYLDITADFAVYGAGVVGVAVGVAGPGAGPADWLPFLAVLLAYYVNGTALLAFSSAAERSGRQVDDGRSLSFLGGLAEGTETIAVHSLWLLLPSYAPAVATVWAVVVGVGAVHRTAVGYRLLRA